MKILMLNSEYPPLGGGQGSANRSLYETFRKYPDLQVDIITASAGRAFVENSGLGRIYYLNIGKRHQNLHHQTVWNLLAYSLQALWRCLGLCRTERYDLIVAWSGVPAGFLAFCVHCVLRVPYIILLRGADVPFHEPKWHWLDRLVFSWLSPFLWKQASAVIANSEALRNSAFRNSPDQTFLVIHNGVNTQKFAPLIERGTHCQPLRLISTGRLSEIKGYHFLIEALEGLPECELTLVGDGSWREVLRSLAREKGVRVHFLGNLPQDRIAQLLPRAHLYVLSSFNEGMSNSLLEAMACGLPVVATDVGGTKELILENGIVVKKGSAGELRNAIAYYLSHPEILTQQGKSSREIAMRFSWDNVAEQFLAEFRRVTNRTCKAN
jgi:glycosyltransferase involved in cell wall biosynthesis